MKQFIHSFALAITLTSGLCAAADRPSQETSLARLQEMVDQLDLTEAQKTQLAPVVSHQARELRTLHENKALKPRHKLKRAREINEAASAQIRALLTPAQQEKYDTLRAENKAHMRTQLQERRKERRAAEN